jgi:hypothetical protein
MGWKNRSAQSMIATMAKYDPLEAYLTRHAGDEVELAFAEVERIIGDDLPASASRPQWWANETDPAGHVQCCAWRAAGYDAFLLPRSRVLFRRRAI